MRGATRSRVSYLSGCDDFNPHSPCGERLTRCIYLVNTFLFQSTLPMRGATMHVQHLSLYQIEFQSTLPMRGATLDDFKFQRKSLISIHTPHAGSDSICHKVRDTRSISIHTPHAGSDDRMSFTMDLFNDFNPHSPCGERLCRQNFLQYTSSISIHTPHAGSDVCPTLQLHPQEIFQSTLPMRGATVL